MPMYNTMETPRGGRQKKSLLSTLKKSSSQKNLMQVDVDENTRSDPDYLFFQQAHEEAMSSNKKTAPPRLLRKSSSTGNLMEDCDDSTGSDGDLIFFQQAHEEANEEATAEAKRAGKSRRALLSKMKRSNSTGKLMDGMDDEGDQCYLQPSKAAEGSADRGRRRVSNLVQTIRRSASRSRLNDDSDDDELKAVQTLEEIETAIAANTPRSENKKKGLRQRLKAREDGEAGGLGANSQHSTKGGRNSRVASKSPARLSEGCDDAIPQERRRERLKAKDGETGGLGASSQHSTKRNSRVASKSPARLSEGCNDAIPPERRRERLKAKDGEAGGLGASSHHSTKRNSRVASKSPARLSGVCDDTTPQERRRERLKAREDGEAGGLGASPHHSTKSGRNSRIASKSPSRLSVGYDDDTPQERRLQRKKSPSRLSNPEVAAAPQVKKRESIKSPSQPLGASNHESMDQKRERRVAKREKSKVAKERRLSSNSDAQGVPLSFDQLVQKKERQESLTTPRFKKKKSMARPQIDQLDLASPVAKKRTQNPIRSNSISKHDDSTISTKDMTSSPVAEDPGYESEGRLGRKKRESKARKSQSPIREVLIHQEMSPHSMKKQSIMNELDEMDARESITSAYLSRQVEALKKKVADLTSENKRVNDQLNKEINENGKLALKLREHELGLAALEKVNESSVAVEVLKKEHESEKREMELLLKEKDGLIGRLQQKINSIRVANDTMQMQRDSSRKSLNETHGNDIEALQRKVETQNAEIDHLMMKLFVLNENRGKDLRQLNELQDELQATKDEKKQLEAEMKTIGKEHAKAMKRKDETVDFLQESLMQLKLKESKERDKARKKAAGRSSSPGFGFKIKMSPGKRGSFGSPRKSSPGKYSPGRYEESPKQLSLRNLVGDSSHDIDPRHQSTSKLDIPF